MGKPCVLPEDFCNYREVLATLPEDIAKANPSWYALHLAAQNMEAEPPRDFGAVAKDINATLSLNGQGAFTPVKLGKLLKNPQSEIDGITSLLESQQRSHDVAATIEPLGAKFPAGADEQTSISASLDYRHPGIARAVL
jgi:hypothetical protein